MVVIGSGELPGSGFWIRIYDPAAGTLLRGHAVPAVAEGALR